MYSLTMLKSLTVWITANCGKFLEMGIKDHLTCVYLPPCYLPGAKHGGGNGIPVELFQILKDDAVKVLPANLENSAVATGLEKVSFHSNPKERQCQRMLKLPHNCTQLTR